MTDISDYKQIFRISFATRLISKLREKGYISRRGISGVNGKKLANEVSVSLPMARRYINAESMPGKITLQKIATWLAVEPLWLLYGDNSAAHSSFQDIDKELFIKIFDQLYPLLYSSKLTKEKYMSIIIGGIDIYCHISTMAADESKDGTISLMVDFLKKNFKS